MNKSPVCDGSATTISAFDTAEVDALVARARHWFTAFDYDDSKKVLAEYARASRAELIQECEARIMRDRLTDKNAQALRDLTIRSAPITMLFKLPGLLARPELRDDEAFRWVFDGLFRVFQQEDKAALRAATERKKGRQDESREALTIARLVAKALTTHGAYEQRLRALLEEAHQQLERMTSG